MPTSIPAIIPGTFYHIYNRGNNRENIFFQERNYAYFLELWWKHIGPIAETWAYCLLRNHFHAVVYIKDQVIDLSGLNSSSTDSNTRVDKRALLSITRGDLTGLKSKKIKDPSQHFSNFFNAYARSVNIAIERTGALFERPFKRIPVDNTAYFLQLVIYIHQNPQKHHFTEDFQTWNYSSYHDLISDSPTRLQRDRLLQLFGSKEDFVRIHQEIQPLQGLDEED
jgi:REP element-mobilizing transposase RayT